MLVISLGSDQSLPAQSEPSPGSPTYRAHKARYAFSFSSCSLVLRLILAASVFTLAGCDLFTKVSAPPAPATPKIQAAQKTVADVAMIATDAAAAIQSEAQAIDGASESVAPDIRAAISEHTQAIMDQAALVTGAGKRLTVEAMPALDSAKRASEDQAKEVVRARDGEAAANKRADDAEKSKLVGWSVIFAVGGAAMIALSIFVVHDLTLALAGAAALAVAMLLGVFAAVLSKITNSPWLLTGVVLAVVGGGVGLIIWLFKSGRLSYPTINGGAKLLAEAIAEKDLSKAEQAAAALRADKDFGKAWERETAK